MRIIVGFVVTLAMLGAVSAGCSSGSGGTSSSTEGTPAAGELADEALVTWTASDGSYSFQHPGSWTQSADAAGHVRFSGRDAFVGVEIKLNAGTDALAAAGTDKQAVSKAFAGYKEISLKASTEVKNAAVLSFEWDAGNSTVTGKPVRARVDRYYIPESGGRIAIMTGSEPVAAFDRETVRDVALSVKVK